jgi:O-antigen ligase
MYLGLGLAGKIVTGVAVATALTLLLRPPSRGWALPLLAYVVFITITMPLAVNRGSAYGPIKAMIVFYVLAVATLAWVKDARQARPIILLFFVGQFLWWGVFGVVNGAVVWHANLSNYDGYGPMMVMGIGLAFYFGLAAGNQRLRWLGFAVAALSVAGVVGSFARGAVLGAIAVVGYIWMRWPQKGRATLALLASAIIVVVTGSLLTDVARGGDPDSPKGFFSDFMTVTKELDSESGGSSNDRRMLWSTAVVIFEQSPVIGAGVGNFGPAAAALPPQMFAGWDMDNPARLWDRALHSSYYQVLCEGGLVGCLLYLWILIDFFRRNAALRTQHALLRWRALSGGEFDLRYLAWGLEAGMVGFLSTSLFYNQLYVHWLYTLFIINTLLYRLTRSRPATAPERARPA